MNFILRKQLLPLNPGKRLLSNEIQYYQWQEKGKSKQYKKQIIQTLSILKQLAEEQNEKRLKKIIYGHSQTKTDIEYFYDYNLQWKNGIDQKMNHQRIKNQENEKISIRKNQHADKKQNKYKTLEGYKGPVQGWHQRFHHYIQMRSKLSNKEQSKFEPQINENSKKLASRYCVGKVEDRLVQFGQKIRNKKLDKLTTLNKSCFKSIDSKISDLCFRLYKDGQKNNMMRQIKPQFSFEPQINQLSQKMDERVQAKRKPLYHLKEKFNINIGKDIKQKFNQSQTNRQKVSDFVGFMKRNDIMIERKKKNVEKKISQTLRQQKQDFKQCTFSPQINKKSTNIIKNQDQILNKVLNQHYELKRSLEKANKYIQQSGQKFRIDQQSSISQISVVDSTNKNQYKQKQKTNQLSNSNTYKYHQFDSINENQQLSDNSQNKQYQIQHKIPISIKENSQEEQLYDSIQQINDDQWQQELDQIENCIKQMMTRTNR